MKSGNKPPEVQAVNEMLRCDKKHRNDDRERICSRHQQSQSDQLGRAGKENRRHADALPKVETGLNRHRAREYSPWNHGHA